MSEVALASLSASEGVSESALGEASEGTLITSSGAHSVVAYADTEAVTEGVFTFLQEANAQKAPESLEAQVHWFTPQEVAVETEITSLMQELEQMTPKERTPEQTRSDPKRQPEGKVEKRDAEAPRGKVDVKGSEKREVFSSLFSMARTFSERPKERNRFYPQPQTRSGKETPDGLPRLESKLERPEILPHAKSEREQEQEDQDQGQGQHQQHKEEQPPKKSGKVKLPGVQAATSSNRSRAAHAASPDEEEDIGNVYVRFMSLMARILGQSEAEAHALYKRIKHRTDQIDKLTLLTQKINSVNGEIDWTNNDEMKALLDEARGMGVDIPEGKTTWTLEEAKLLKENIDMRKDSMEKVTQLERTDMQRYLQESSQCHQARSNILKLLKEVTDTIIHNLRP